MLRGHPRSRRRYLSAAHHDHRRRPSAPTAQFCSIETCRSRAAGFARRPRWAGVEGRTQASSGHFRRTTRSATSPANRQGGGVFGKRGTCGERQERVYVRCEILTDSAPLLGAFFFIGPFAAVVDPSAGRPTISSNWEYRRTGNCQCASPVGRTFPFPTVEEFFGTCEAA